MTPPDKEQAKEIIQRAQTLLGELQMRYPGDSLEFWALRLAWEATRSAWYIVDNNSLEKLGEVREAWQDFQERLPGARGRNQD